MQGRRRLFFGDPLPAPTSMRERFWFFAPRPAFLRVKEGQTPQALRAASLRPSLKKSGRS